MSIILINEYNYVYLIYVFIKNEWYVLINDCKGSVRHGVIAGGTLRRDGPIGDLILRTIGN